MSWDTWNVISEIQLVACKTWHLICYAQGVVNFVSKFPVSGPSSNGLGAVRKWRHLFRVSLDLPPFPSCHEKSCFTLPQPPKPIQIVTFYPASQSEFLENQLKMDQIGFKKLWKLNCHSLLVKKTHMSDSQISLVIENCFMPDPPSPHYNGKSFFCFTPSSLWWHLS